MLSTDNVLSQTITFLRLPLMVLVVFIHTDLTDVIIQGVPLVEEGDFPLHDWLRYLVSNELAAIAVPLFFFISGFLFFRNRSFSLSIYGEKLKKRARTLLVPYLFWNVVVLLLTLATQLFLSSMTSGKNKLIADYGLADWVGLFWDYREGMPICYQFWFIRDLMVVMLCSPLVYLLLRYAKAFGLLLLGALWLFGFWVKVPGLSGTAFFFFAAGSWFSLNGRNFAADFRSLLWPVTAGYLLIVLANTVWWSCDGTGSPLLHRLGIIVGLVAVVAWTARGIASGRLRANAFLAGSSFFIYAYHGMPIAFLVKYWVKLLPPSEAMMITGYFLIPVVIVAVGTGLYALLKRYLPAFTGIITGER